MCLKSVRRVWGFRGFILGTVKRDFQARYRNSLLGAAWTVINPLAMIAVYTLVFSQVMRARLPGVDSTFAYSIYLMSGLIPWGLFSEIVNRGQSMFLDHANLIKKVSFPRACIPITVVLTSLVNFSIVLGLFITVAIILGIVPGWSLLAMLPLLLIQLVFATALALILGILNVFFRDVGQMTSIFLQFCFWLTPIVYSIDIIPEPFQGWIGLNPLAPLFAGYQRIFVQNIVPDWYSLAPTIICAFLLMAFAVATYNRRLSDLMDEL